MKIQPICTIISWIELSFSKINQTEPNPNELFKIFIEPNRTPIRFSKQQLNRTEPEQFFRLRVEPNRTRTQKDRFVSVSGKILLVTVQLYEKMRL
jgi:hypothetical protein